MTENKKNNLDKTSTENEVNEEEIAEALEEAEDTVEEEVNIELSPDEQIQDLEDRNLRLLAEMQNLRGRNQKDMKEAREYAIAGFAQDMLTILENLNRAKDNIPVEEENEVFKQLVVGIDLVREEVIRTFAKHGIERVAPEPGDDFDYKFHQALVQIPTNEVADGKVAQLIHAGYTIKDRILKPAMVGVAKAAPEANDRPEEASDEKEKSA